MEIKIDHTAVEKAITEAVINSSIGKQIEKAISEVLTRSGGIYDKKSLVQTAVEKALLKHVDAVIVEHLHGRKEEIAALISKQLTTETIDTIVEATWSTVKKKLQQIERY